jgi:hypothetical protein
VELLPSAESAYNKSVHSSADKTPFKMVLRLMSSFHMLPAGETPAKEGESKSAREKAEQLKQSIKENKKLWEQT